MTERPRGPWLRLIKWLLLLVVLGSVVAAGTVVFIFWMYGRDPNLPDYAKLSDYHPKQVTKIVDANDHQIGELYNQRRTFVAYDKIPAHVVDAFVAAEDNSFWTHGGVDYWGMFRALVKNLRAGHAREGASTITQQVIKNLLLTPERTFKRKIQEIILARRLESQLTKEEILTIYLNEINFGSARYGVQEAARFYFGKDISKVTVGEAAVLASLPKEPGPFSRALRDPNLNADRARRVKDRQTYVLNQLVAIGKLSLADAQKWIDAPIPVVCTARIPVPVNCAAPQAGSEWVELAKRELLAQNHGNEAVIDSGGTVRMTLDSSIQDMAQRALQNGLRAIDKRHGIGRAIKNIKPDKVDGELAKLTKRLPKAGPQAKEIYDAVVTEVFDSDREVAVDLGDWKAAIILGGEDDDRFNPKDADGNTKKPSERFKPGDLVSVTLPASATKAADDDDDDADANAVAKPEAKTEAKKKKLVVGPKHAKHRVMFAPGPEGAVVVIDVKSRKVRALVGGYASKIAGFNRAIQAHRQPGSSFKPYVYTAAIDSGKYTPATIVNDVQETYDNLPGWKPKNFETGKNQGPVRLRYALAQSINMVSLQLAENIKLENVIAMAKRMGISSNLTPEMSIALGSNEVTPLENTNGVATLAAGGIYSPPMFVEAIDGKSLPAPVGEQVVRPEVAYVVLDMMRSVVTEGTAIQAASLKIPISGKTGTSNDAKDTWFIGLTPDYAIGVWVGYDDDRPQGRETGGSNAVPVYVELMKQLAPPAKSFPRPAHVVEATIDKKTGLLAPDGAPKGTTMTEVFVEGSAPTEVAPMPDDVTEDNKTKTEYSD